MPTKEPIETCGTTRDRYVEAMEILGLDRRDGPTVLKVVRAFMRADKSDMIGIDDATLAEMGTTRERAEARIREEASTIAMLCLDCSRGFTCVPTPNEEKIP